MDASNWLVLTLGVHFNQSLRNGKSTAVNVPREGCSQSLNGHARRTLETNEGVTSLSGWDWRGCGYDNCHLGASPVSALWRSDREKPLLEMSYDILAAVCQKAWGRLWSQMEEEPLDWWDQNWAFGHRTKCHVWCSPIAVHHQKCTILTVKRGDVLRQILEGLWGVADEINAAKHG